MEFTVQNLCGFLIRSKLMSAEGMRAMHQRWQAEARDQASNTSQFVRWLISNKYVTEYQASLLAKGHSDDFFINEYMILERLGRGRMAGVYKAAHPLGQVVAIKVLPPSRAKNPQVLGRFQREAKLSMKLKHPNVVRTFQVGQMGEVNYLVMEFIDGETLDSVLQRRKRLPPAEAVRIVHQALTGLQHLYDQGMVHRDLKPANLMLTPPPADSTLKSTVKILDIGLARQMAEEGQGGLDNRLELTVEGVLLGTPDYLSPEQARDPRSVDVRADIYSLGCVLYHGLTGQPPFPDTNILSQMVRHATEAPRPLKEFNPQIPDGLQQIVSWMMAKQRDERYPTPERAAQALQMFLLADNAPAQAEEESPQLRTYLTWLEMNKNHEAEEDSEEDTLNMPAYAAAVARAAAGAPAPPAPPAGKPPSNPLAPVAKPPSNPALASAAAASAATANSVPQVGRPEAERPARRKDRTAKRANVADTAPWSPVAVPAGAEAAAALPVQFDVEMTEAEERASWWPLAKRDWLLIGFGAGAMLVLTGVGFAVSMLFGS